MRLDISPKPIEAHQVQIETYANKLQRTQHKFFKTDEKERNK